MHTRTLIVLISADARCPARHGHGTLAQSIEPHSGRIFRTFQAGFRTLRGGAASVVDVPDRGHPEATLFPLTAMTLLLARIAASSTDIGLLFLRVSASVLLLVVHGLPKIEHYRREAAAIEDPFHLGKKLTIGFAIFAEVVCPLLMIVGFATRLCALPVMAVTAIALLRVHPEWRIDQAQFAWMLLILFGTIAIAGAGRYSLSALVRKRE